MKIGCFALVKPFQAMRAQFAAIREMGIGYADITDNHSGGMLGVEYGFTSSVSLDSHPSSVRRLVEESGIELTAFCAHANLLDPPSPSVYGTCEIIKAIRLASLLGIEHVITTEGDPHTQHGHHLNPEERIFAMVEKLRSPVEWAAELGIKLLLEPHGPVTGTLLGMAQVLDRLGFPESLGVCLDTGNSWLGGEEPVNYVRQFGSRIHHLHWKDMPSEMESRRGELFGCGMGSIPLGDGVVGIPEIVRELKKVKFSGAMTLEVAGEANVRLSHQRLSDWWNEEQ